MLKISKSFKFSYIAVILFLISAFTFALARTQASETDARFIRSEKSVAIYHAGWIDFNKNGKKDTYEDSSQEVEKRIDDLLKRMTIEEKTAQMVTLYGFPRVLKDELPNDSWLTSSWKDGIGNVDEHSNGTGQPGVPKSKFAWPLENHVRLLNEGTSRNRVGRG